jgi:hypothetical protein
MPLTPSRSGFEPALKGIKFQEKALSYCQNDAEKAAVYALCAIQPLEDGLPMLKKIVELNPKNNLIELITAREINKNEYYSLSDSVRRRYCCF